MKVVLTLCSDCIIKFALTLGNLLARLLYGGKLGLLRESPRATQNCDKYGRERMYINESPIREKSNGLHCMLSLRVLVFLGFCLAAGADAFFVQSELTCDVSRNCYILDDAYDPNPITDCSVVIDSDNLTAVCYEIVLDTSNALSTMGGLLTFSIVETAIVAYMIICLYKQCCHRCSGCKGHRLCIIIAIQGVFALVTIAVAVGLYLCFVDRPADATALHRAGAWIRFLGYPCSFAFSILVPWYQVVDANLQCKMCNNNRSDNSNYESI